jgi:hypothetical protein
MAGLIARVARAILDGPTDDPRACAEAAAREVLAAVREPSEAIRRPFMAWRLFGAPKLEGAWAAAVDIRAREHGL